MCSPLFFKKVDVDHQVILLQWQRLHHYLIRLGCYIEYSPPKEEYPNMVFTANSGLIKDQTVVLSNVKTCEKETEIFRHRLKSFGFEIFELPRAISFESRDALLHNNTLFAGFGVKTEKIAYYRITEVLKIESTIFCELNGDFHLDQCLFPLNSGNILIYEPAFTTETVEKMSNIVKIHTVSEEEILACNSVVIEDRRSVLISPGCPNAKVIIENLGYTVHEITTNEFNSGCKALVLKL